jgi:EmrB/QacA subfamily drug resistance transporter
VLLCTAQFMVVLDGTIINVALPTIQQALDLSPENLQWIVTAYALTFGGFLILGGRLGDLFGRRRALIAGLVLFSVASLVGGLAPSGGVLIAARALQGLGGALASPAALSLLTTTFREGEERNRALGIFGGIAASGFAAGVLLGGALTATVGWRWVLFVNVPIGVLAALAAPALLAESRTRGSRHIDLAGAFALTAGLVALVYGVTSVERAGLSSAVTLGTLALAVVLLGAFVVVQRRARQPLVRLGIFANRSLTAANVLGMLVPGTFGLTLFVLTLHLQQVLAYGVLLTGVAFLPMAVVVIVVSNVAARFVGRLGVKAIMVAGSAVMAAALAWFATGVPAGTNYWTDLLPAMVGVSVGFGLAVNGATIASVAGVSDDEQGLASGLFNSAGQIGAALVLAVGVVVSSARTATLRAAGTPAPAALVGGFSWAFAVGAACVLVAALVALLVARTDECQRAARRLAEPDQRARFLAECRTNATR